MLIRSSKYSCIPFWLRIAVLLPLLIITALTQVAQANDYRFKSLKLSDGMPSNEILQIFQQHNGYIWFATDEGVSRFDGQNHKYYKYNPGKPNHLSNNFVNQMIEDKNKNIWIGTDNGLNKLKPDGTIEYFYKKDGQNNGIISSWIITLKEQLNHGVWVGTGHGLALYNEQNDAFLNIPFTPSGEMSPEFYSVYAIEIDENDRVWVATDFGLATVNLDSFQLEFIKVNDDSAQTVLNDVIHTLLSINDGYLYVGSEMFGLYKFNLKTKETILLPHLDNSNENTKGKSVITLALINDDQLWIGHHDGISIYHLKEKQFEQIKHLKSNQLSLHNNSVRYIFEDKSGIVWISTVSGIAYYSPLKKSTTIYNKLSPISSLSEKNINHLTKTSDNALWLATDKGVDRFQISNKKISQFDNKTETGTVTTKTFPNYVWNIAQGSNGDIWMAHPKGLSVYNLKNDRLSHFSNAEGNKYKLPEREFYTVVGDGSGGVWFTGYMGVGLIHFHPDKGIVKQYLHANESVYAEGGNFTNAMLLSKVGEIWLATTDGIYRINPATDKVYNYLLSENRSAIRGTSLVEDEQGVIWAGSQGAGLVRFEVNPNNDEPVNMTFITKKDGLPSNSLKSIAIGDNGTLWVTSQNVLFSYQQKTKSVTTYSSLLDKQHFSFLDNSAQYSSGLLYLGMNKGLLEVDTRIISTNEFTPSIQFTEVISSGQNQHESVNFNSKEPTIFPYEKNSLQFNYTALDYSEYKQNVYRYKLQGFDQQWTDAGNSTRVMYTNLDAGSYTFKVQGTNSDGVWSNQEATYSFQIKQAWWVYTLSVLALISVVFCILFIVTRIGKFKQLNVLANRDSLTGLANRYRFNKELEALIEKGNSKFSLVFLDLDNFKDINDTMGHDVGDQLIIEVGERLNNSVRNNDLLARLGGDEYAIILDDRVNPENLDVIMTRIEHTLSNGYQIGEHWIKSSASIGVARFPVDGDTSTTLLKNADTAMYAAKNNGRNKISYFDNHMSQIVKAQMKIRNKLHHAILEDQFVLYYQPKIESTTGSVCGFEALIRWIDPIEGEISPAVFIPEAEQSGLILDIGNWVLSKACKQIDIWHRKGLLRTNVSVNISVAQLLQEHFVNNLKELLQLYDFPPEKLELEITESLFMGDIERAKNILNKIKALNVKIALDDFGTGYASLSYISGLPIDTLKIDRSFIEHCVEQQSAKKLLTIIFTLAKQFNMEVVAEGVETSAQSAVLAEFDCEFLQGFLYSKAVNTAAATQLFNDENCDWLLPVSENINELIENKFSEQV